MSHTRTVRLPINRIESLGQIGRASRKLEQEYVRSVTEEEIAEEIGMGENQVREALAMGRNAVSLDTSWREEGEGSLLDIVADDHPSPESEALDRSLGEDLETELSSLNVRQADVLRHYFGLGLRFVTSMDNVGQFFNATGQPGKTVRGTERLVRATWCAYTAPVDGKPVTVALFDHPDNARHPATWFTMTQSFAYIAATLNLSEQPLTLSADRPLRLRYGLALWDGEVSPDAVQQAYQQWVK